MVDVLQAAGEKNNVPSAVFPLKVKQSEQTMNHKNEIHSSYPLLRLES